MTFVYSFLLVPGPETVLTYWAHQDEGLASIQNYRAETLLIPNSLVNPQRPLSSPCALSKALMREA